MKTIDWFSIDKDGKKFIAKGVGFSYYYSSQKLGSAGGEYRGDRDLVFGKGRCD